MVKECHRNLREGFKRVMVSEISNSDYFITKLNDKNNFTRQV